MANISQSLDTRLRLAIAERRLIEVSYNGRRRIAEPHDYGIRNGIERLLIYQLSGPVRSPSRSATGWRLLDTSKIEACLVLDDNFSGGRGQSHRTHLDWSVVYTRVAGAADI